MLGPSSVRARLCSPSFRIHILPRSLLSGCSVQVWGQFLEFKWDVEALEIFPGNIWGGESRPERERGPGGCPVSETEPFPLVAAMPTGNANLGWALCFVLTLFWTVFFLETIGWLLGGLYLRCEWYVWFTYGCRLQGHEACRGVSSRDVTETFSDSASDTD